MYIYIYIYICIYIHKCFRKFCFKTAFLWKNVHKLINVFFQKSTISNQVTKLLKSVGRSYGKLPKNIKKDLKLSFKHSGELEKVYV